MLKRAFCLLFVMLLCLCGCGATQAPLSWQEQYDLGVRYLNEGNYEEAILAFEAAIAIDPKRPEAYASLADAHFAAGDEAAAKAVLEEGFAATGDQGLQDRLEEDPNEGMTPTERNLFSGPYLVPEDVELLGMTLEDASALALADGIYDSENSSIALEGDLWRFSSLSVWFNETEGYSVLDLYQSNGSAAVDEVQFHGWREDGAEIAVPVHTRGISLSDEWQQVLNALGFSEEEIDLIGGPQDVSVTRETENSQNVWRVGFTGEPSTDGTGRIHFSYRDNAGEIQISLEFFEGVLNNFLVYGSSAV